MLIDSSFIDQNTWLSKSYYRGCANGSLQAVLMWMTHVKSCSALVATFPEFSYNFEGNKLNLQQLCIKLYTSVEERCMLTTWQIKTALRSDSGHPSSSRHVLQLQFITWMTLPVFHKVLSFIAVVARDSHCSGYWHPCSATSVIL